MRKNNEIDNRNQSKYYDVDHVPGYSIPVITNNGLEEMSNTHKKVFTRINPKDIPLITQTRLAADETNNVVVAFNYLATNDSFPASEVKDRIMDITNDITTFYINDFKSEMIHLLFQAKRKMVINIYRYIVDNFKSIIDFDMFTKAVQQTLLGPDPFNVELQLISNLTNYNSCMRYIYKDLFDDDDDMEEESEKTTRLNEITGMMSSGLIYANNVVQKVYYEMYRIIGVVTFPDFIDNLQLMAIMTEIEATGIFHDYHDDITDIISYMFNRLDDIKEIRDDFKKQFEND